MKQSTKRIVSLLISFGFVLGGIMMLSLAVLPAYDDVKMLRGQIRGDEESIASYKDPVNTARALIAAYQNPNISERIGLALPLDPQVDDALVQLTGISDNAHVIPKSFNISRIIVAQSGKQLTEGSSTISIKPYGMVSFRVRLVGNYDDLKTFFENLENNVRIFDVQSLSVAPVDSKGLQDLYNYDAAIVAYYQPMN